MASTETELLDHIRRSILENKNERALSYLFSKEGIRCISKLLTQANKKWKFGQESLLVLVYLSQLVISSKQNEFSHCITEIEEVSVIKKAIEKHNEEHVIHRNFKNMLTNTNHDNAPAISSNEKCPDDIQEVLSVALLIIAEKALENNDFVLELIENNEISFLDLLISDLGITQQIHSHVTKQIVRTLTPIFSKVSLSQRAISSIEERGIIEKCAAALKSGYGGTEFALITVQFLWRVCSVSLDPSNFIASFISFDGHNSLVDISSKSKSFNKVDKENVLEFLSQSLFIGQSSVLEGSLNEVGFKLLVDAFVRQPEKEFRDEIKQIFKSALLILATHGFKEIQIERGDVLVNLFINDFSSLNGELRHEIIDIIKETEIIEHFSDDELSALCSLLLHPESILDTAGLVVDTIREGLNRDPARLSERLNNAGLCETIIPYFSILLDKIEQDKDKDSDQDYIFSLCLYTKIIQFSKTYITGNIKTLDKFRGSIVLRSIEKFVHYEETRGGALELIYVIGSVEPSQADDLAITSKDRVVQGLLTILQTLGGTSVGDPSILALWTDVLITLASLMNARKSAGLAFRAFGGFTWIISVVHGVSQQGNAKTDDSVSRFYLSVLHALHGALNVSPENISYIRSNFLFSTFTDVLKTCVCQCGDIQQGADVLLSTAVNSECDLIEIPEIIEIILIDLLEPIGTTDKDAQLKVLARVHELLFSSQDNAESVCSCGDASVQVHIITHYGAQLFSGNDPSMKLLSEILCDLCSYNATAEVAKKLFKLASSTNFDSAALEFIRKMVPEKEDIPTSFLKLSNAYGHVFGLRSMSLNSFDYAPHAKTILWPPQSLTLSTWVCIDSRTKAVPLINVFCESSNSTNAPSLSLSITEDEKMFFKVLPRSKEQCPSTEIVFSKFSFIPGEWHHVVLTYAAEREKSYGPAPCSVSLYVDGILSEEAKMIIEAEKPAIPTIALGDTTSVSNESKWSISVSNVYMLRRHANALEAFVLYSLGPSLSGKLDCNITYQTRCLGGFYCKNDTEYEKKRSEMTAKMLSLMDRIEVSNLWGDIMCVVLAANASVIMFEHNTLEIPLSPTQKSAYTESWVHKRRTMRESIAATGGISLCLYILGVAETGSKQLSGIRLLTKLLNHSPINIYDMRRLHGHELIARFMQKPSWVLNNDLLDAIFDLVRSRRLEAPVDNSNSVGPIVDPDALKLILLDWRIWERADDQLKVSLFDNLHLLFAGFPEFNIKQAFKCNVVKELLQIMWNQDVKLPIATKIVEVIQYMVKPKGYRVNTLEGAEEVALFLLATHKSEKNIRHTFRTPRVKHFRKSSSALMSATSSTPIKSSNISSILSNSMNSLSSSPGSNSSSNGNVESDESKANSTGSPKTRKRGSTASVMIIPKSGADILSIRKRVMLFDVLYGMLEDKDIPEKFFSKVLPLNNIMYMLQTPDPEIRSCLLKLLSFLIDTQKTTDKKSSGSPSTNGISTSFGGFIHFTPTKKPATHLQSKDLTDTNFIVAGGFDFLGMLLQSYSLTQGLLHVLFRLMIGNKFPAVSTTDVFITLRSVLAENSMEDIPLKHPEMAKTILRVTASQLAEYREQYSVIKAFHVMCSTSQETLSQLLDNNLLHGIFEVLLSRTTRRKQAHLVQFLRFDLADNRKTDDENDEDIMALVKTIIIGSTDGKNCAKNMNEALLLVNSMGFSHKEEFRLQARIAGDVIKFYQENPGFYESANVVTSFIQVSKTIMNYVWRAKCIENTENDGVEDDEDDDYADEDHLKIDDISMDDVVVSLLKLLECLLRAVGTPKYKDIIKLNVKTAMDITWHMLLYIFKLPNQSEKVINAGILAICSKPVLAYAEPDRCVAIMIYLSKVCDSSFSSLDARTAFNLLRSIVLNSQGGSNNNNNGITSGLTPIDMFRGNIMRAQNPAITHFGMQNAIAADTNKISQGLIEDAINWDVSECEAEERFVAEQTAALEHMRAEIEQFYSSIQVKRLSISDKIGNTHLRAQTALYAAQADRYQREDAAAHTSWKEVFRNATSECSPCAFVLHAPFRRAAIDTTYDRLGQRLRLKLKVSDPDAPTLNSPYIVPKLSCERDNELIIPVHASDISFAYSFDENVESIEEKFPVLLGIDPPYEKGLNGGCKIVLKGAKFGGNDFKVLIGGHDAEIVEISSDKKEVVVLSPRQKNWGFYEVTTVKNGCLSHSKQIKYGYLEIDEYRRYMEAKYSVPLDPSLVYVCGQDEPRAGIKKLEKPSNEPANANDLKSKTSVATSKRLKTTTLKIMQDDKVHFVGRATRVSAYSELEGEVVLSDKKISFFVDSAKVLEKKYQFSQDKAQSWSYGDVYEMLKRRYLLRDIGVEIYFITGKAAFFAFSDTQTRDIFMENVQSVPHKTKSGSTPSTGKDDSDSGDPKKGSGISAYADGDAAEDITSSSVNTKKYTDKWVRGEMSNFEYLMRLNMLGGRTYNDLNQYPVFPFILSDYSSEKLDLSDPKVFRDLSKPMGAQNTERMEKARMRYEQLAEMGEVPYNYGTHYSSSGAVLHFMSRLEPYASYHVAFQSGHFDVPDRLFFDMESTWRLASSSPMGDAKELIPEFFCLPEIFENTNNFDFGERQNGVRVYGVRLPPWAKNDSREFVRIHREALECEYVSAHLHEWIDLIFGYKQQSKEALNVFHPYTCEGGIDWDAIKDPMDRLSKQTQVNTWGQTPRKLFRKAHPPRNMKLIHRRLTVPSLADVNTKIKSSLVDNIYVPVMFLGIATVDKTLISDGPCKAHVLTGSHSQFITWGNWDNTIYVETEESQSQQSQQQKQRQKQKREIKVNNCVTVASLSRSGHCFTCGTDNGAILVWRRHSSSKPILSGRFTKLYGHDHPITAIEVSSDHNIVVTGSGDGMCIVWDINNFSYVRTLEHKGAIKAIAISPTLGHIYTLERICDSPKSKSAITLWSINGNLIARAVADHQAVSLKASPGIPGVSRNFLAIGNEDGTISLRDAYTLDLLRTLSGTTKVPVTAIAFTRDLDCMYTGNISGEVTKWTV